MGYPLYLSIPFSPSINVSFESDNNNHFITISDNGIGMDKENPIHSFVKGYRSGSRFFPAQGNITICGTFIESDDNTGLALKIEPFQLV